jgi:hypothetical protein
MRTFLVAIAILGMFASAARAAGDTLPLLVTLPDTEENLKVYLFNLKDNKILLSMTPQEFCHTMHYGEAVLGWQPTEPGKDDKGTPGKLNWVICRFKGK